MLVCRTIRWAALCSLPDCELGIRGAHLTAVRRSGSTFALSFRLSHILALPYPRAMALCPLQRRPLERRATVAVALLQSRSP
jgi:hypothetical protein